MHVEESFATVAWFFNTWVRLLEYHTRKMEVFESATLGSRRLIISPPTDAGIPLLARANTHGETLLLCFSNRIKRIAIRYCRKRGVESLAMVVKPFFQIPAADESLSVVYANCLFDFCAADEFDSMLSEIWRVLEPEGVLFAVHMAPPEHGSGRLWAWIFDHLIFLSHGCYPVHLEAPLRSIGFDILKDMPAARFGFPIRYSVLLKPVTVA